MLRFGQRCSVNRINVDVRSGKTVIMRKVSWYELAGLIGIVRVGKPPQILGLRVGAAAARYAHNVEVKGSNPLPVTNLLFSDNRVVT